MDLQWVREWQQCLDQEMVLETVQERGQERVIQSELQWVLEWQQCLDQEMVLEKGQATAQEKDLERDLGTVLATAQGTV